jgi:hypothetical protein
MMSSFFFAPLIRPDRGTTANRDAVRKGTYRSWDAARYLAVLVLVLEYEDNDDNDDNDNSAVQCTAIAIAIAIAQNISIF